MRRLRLYLCLQVLRDLLPEQEVLSGMRNACLLINPGCTSSFYNAAITGTTTLTLPA